MATAVKTISNPPQSWYVEAAVTDLSLSYTYTVYTTTDITPGGVKQGFSNAINQAMPPPPKTNSTTVAPGSQPTLEVTNSGTVIS
jgi:hypothetical protein